jgi:hypothetical protein
MDMINVEVRAQNLLVPSSNQHAHQHQAAASSVNVVEVRSVHTLRPWNPDTSRINYWAEQPSHSSTFSLHNLPGLEIHLCHTSVAPAITQVCTKPSSCQTIVAACEPDSTSATFDKPEPESINLTTIGDVPVPRPLPMVCRGKNRHVITLLEKTGYLQNTTVSKDNTMFPSELVVAAVRFISQKEPEDAERNKVGLVRGILRDRGCYGGQADEAITSDYTRQILRRWITNVLFNAPLEDLIVQHLATSARPSAITTSELAEWLRVKTRMLLQQGVVDTHTSHPLLTQTECWIWENIHSYVAPLLMYSEHNSDLTLALTDPQWGQMHAGFLFAIQYGFDIHTISKELVLEAGKLLMRSLDSTNCFFVVHDYFDLPARCHQVQILHLQGQPYLLDKIERSAADTHALNNYFAAATHASLIHPLIVPLREALKNYQTRLQITERIIRENCPGTHKNDLLENSEGLLLNNVQLIYGDPSRKFSDQNLNIADAFLTLDIALTAEAFSRLEEQEIEFISRASIQFAQGDISTIKGGLAPSMSLPPLLPLLRMLLRLNPYKTENFFLDLIEGMDIFVASTPAEQRIYALEIHNSGYDVKRIFTHDDTRLVTGSIIKLVSKQQTLHEVQLRNVVLVPETNKNQLQELLNNISLQHKYRFYLHLHFRGIAPPQPDTIACIGASFEALCNGLDENVKRCLRDSPRIRETPLSDKQSRVLPDITERIISACMAGSSQIYTVARLVGKQYNGKDIYVQINPRNGMLFGYKFTLSEHQLLEPVPFDLVQSTSTANPGNHMADVASGSGLGKRNAVSRKSVRNHAHPKRKALTKCSKAAFPDNAGATAQVPGKPDHSDLPESLRRWTYIVGGEVHRSRQPDTTGMNQTAKSSSQQSRILPPQQPPSSSDASASHLADPASTMIAGAHYPAASSSGLNRGLEAPGSGPGTVFNAMSLFSDQTKQEKQLPIKKRGRQISPDGATSTNPASMAVNPVSAQNQ